MWEQVIRNIVKYWSQTTCWDLISLEDYPRKLSALRNVSIFRHSRALCCTTENVLAPFRTLDSFAISDDTFFPLFPGCIAVFNSLTLKSFNVAMRRRFFFQELKEKLELSSLQTLSFNYNTSGYDRHFHFPNDFESLLTCTPSIQELKVGYFSVRTLPVLDNVPVILSLKLLSLRSFICPEEALNELISSCKVLESLALNEIQCAMLDTVAGTWAHVPRLANFEFEANLEVMLPQALWDDGTCTNLEMNLKNSRKGCNIKFHRKTWR
ncbi:hypothetical protein BT69DRAFT_1295003 [Atractiella rhizophila]|nr:hypothetical protein BT69DRAFT_1295003 [Atractiella rhizophila]